MKYFIAVLFFFSCFADEEGSFVQKIAKELLNENYNLLTRRSESVVKKEYRDLLDEWFDPSYSHKTYPKNSRGSLCRMTIDEVEFFVNIPKLYQRVKEVSKDRELILSLDGKSLSTIRDLFVIALEIVGDKDYEVEWQHELTREQYDIDLTDMTSAYDIGNLELSKKVIPLLDEWIKSRPDDFFILDAGVGSGNTIRPILHHIVKDNLPKDRIKILLFDIDPAKTAALKRAIVSNLNFPVENVIVREGQLNDIGDCFYDYKGKINCIVSGAAICHVSNKGKFFKSLYTFIASEGDVFLWDPIFPLNYSTYLCIADNEEDIGKRFICLQGENKPLLKLDRHEKLSDEILRLQKQGKEIITISPVSKEMARRIAAFSGYIYPLQLGYRKGMTITEQDEQNMVQEATDYIFKKFSSKPGYSFFQYIRWLNDHEMFKSYAFKESERSKYQLIEAYEDFGAHEKYCKDANFNIVSFNFLTSPEDGKGDIASAGCALFHLKKR